VARKDDDIDREIDTAIKIQEIESWRKLVADPQLKLLYDNQQLLMETRRRWVVQRATVKLALFGGLLVAIDALLGVCFFASHCSVKETSLLLLELGKLAR